MKISFNNREYSLTYANTFFKRLIGLMFKNDINEIILFPGCRSIHTFFMKQNIDIFFFDKNKKLIDIRRNIPKNKILNNKKAYYVLETKVNLFNSDNIILIDKEK